MRRFFSIAAWTGVALLGASALGAIALRRGETLNAIWFVIAALCSYLIAYRLYSAFIAARLLSLDDTRATPSERHDDGRDFEKRGCSSSEARAKSYASRRASS